ncbi:hypothetical protein KMZ29_12435 [Bradyrhizobium sediminis]|uniref:Cell envelope biogenesis protein TolA n=1 Tax=Bradyrhizobium sediminis TaxID=2840469 RepID=A0A975RQC2_9BRAD|nr:hypothetical protein KMZ29_12435 [Bradyrhizobium sediminis]
MELRQTIRTGIAASAIAHLSVLMLVLLFGEVHPFGSVTAEPIAVDIVTAEEVAEKKSEPPLAPEAKPSDAFDLAAKSAAGSSMAPAAAPQEAAARSQEPAAPSPPPSAGKMAAVQPPPPSQPTSPAYVPAEPDLSVKYQVVLGLPQDLSPAGSGGKSGDPFDAPASVPADIASNLVAEFRRHLRTCLRLPRSIAPSDRLRIKLRVYLSPEGRLAAEPVLIEASASAKGPALMQGAIGALQACQPYAMLPADRYGEWKVLDLSFTPQDFSG